MEINKHLEGKLLAGSPQGGQVEPTLGVQATDAAASLGAWIHKESPEKKPKTTGTRLSLSGGGRASLAARKAETAAARVTLEAAQRDAELCASKCAALAGIAEARSTLGGLPTDQQQALAGRLDAAERTLKELPVCPPRPT